MTATELNEYYPGKGCECAAYYEGECCCDVDWTPKRVYELEAELKRERDRGNNLAKAVNAIARGLFSTRNAQVIAKQVIAEYERVNGTEAK